MFIWIKSNKIIVFLCGAAVLSGLMWFLREPLINAGIKKVALKQLKTNEEFIKSDALHLVVIGSGNNKYTPGRNQPCFLVIAGGRILVFDAGLSAAQEISYQKLPMEKIEAVFISHYHSDHYAGLGGLIEAGWLFGDQIRSQPMPVFGPEGIVDVVDGVNLMYRQNTLIRTAVHGLPEKGALGSAHIVPIDNDQPVKLFDRQGLKVFSFPVEHQNPLAESDYTMKAVGYRIEYKNRTIVYAGDTKPFPKMAVYARNADILIHEAFDNTTSIKVIRLMKEIGQDKIARLITKSNAHHSPVLDVAQIARQANVKHLIFNHIRHSPGVLGNWLFMRGVKKMFKGKVDIAEDGMDFYLPPMSTHGLK